MHLDWRGLSIAVLATLISVLVMFIAQHWRRPLQHWRN
jgi:hypothetical protein